MLKMLGMLGLASLLVGAMGARAGGEALFEDIIVIPLDPARTHRGQTGSIVELKDGSLLFALPALGKTKYSGIVGRKSSDGGRTWSEEFLLAPSFGKMSAIAPTLRRLANGAILLGYDFHASGQPYFGQVYVRQSTDEGQTWSEQVCASPYPSECLTEPHKIVQLSSGRILVPVTSKQYPTGSQYVSYCFYSDDGGYRWWPSRNVVDVGSTTQEPSIVELKDGRLLMICRTAIGYLAKACSDDGGETWAKPELVKELPSACAPEYITRIPSTGDLLIIWCNNPHAPGLVQGEEQPTVKVAQLQLKLGHLRTPLSSAVSRDGGETWEHVRNIAEDPEGEYGDYGYPGVTFIEDGTIALVNYNAIDGIRLARIHVDWFYGK